MQQKQAAIPVLFQRCAVVLLYLCFFIVQFSANYNYATQSASFSLTPNHFVRNNNHAFAISKADKSEDRKVNIRLNKRFAPSPILCCEPNFTVASVLYTTITKSALVYQAPFIPSSHLRIKALRGPPVVV